MKKIIRVALSFATFNNDELNSLAILVIVCLKTNPLFPNLPVKIADLTALQAVFQAAITAAATGGVMQTAAQNEAREALVFALRQTAAYIQSLGLVNVSDVLSSGFDVVVSNHNPQMPLGVPVLTGLDNSLSTQLLLRLQSVTNAKAYQVQYCAGTAPWQDAGIFPNSRGIVLMNLTPGTVYTARVRAIGGSTRYSDWSASTSLMAT
jgi:hypothetical protein